MEGGYSIAFPPPHGVPRHPSPPPVLTVTLDAARRQNQVVQGDAAFAPCPNHPLDEDLGLESTQSTREGGEGGASPLPHPFSCC